MTSPPFKGGDRGVGDSGGGSKPISIKASACIALAPLDPERHRRSLVQPVRALFGHGQTQALFGDINAAEPDSWQERRVCNASARTCHSRCGPDHVKNKTPN